MPPAPIPTFGVVTATSYFKLSPTIRVEIDLIRGGIRIGERPSRSQARILAVIAGRLTSPHLVKLKVDTAGDVIRIRAEYPPRSIASSELQECLPPEDQRGDFFHSDVGIQLSLDVPPGTRVTARILAGDIEAIAPHSDLDLQTNTGRVYLRSDQAFTRSARYGGERVVADRRRKSH